MRGRPTWYSGTENGPEQRGLFDPPEPGPDSGFRVTWARSFLGMSKGERTKAADAIRRYAETLLEYANDLEKGGVVGGSVVEVGEWRGVD